jgi:uncharacterized protein YijF (DUF1287 family)
VLKSIFFIAVTATLLFAQGSKSVALVEAARGQVGVTKIYDPAYVRIKFPMGDITKLRGVCTDVVVRAFRGVGIDLQKEIYIDKKKHPGRYKGLYYTDRLDPNIDHRRVKNLQAYFEAKGYRVKGEFKAGDIVVWKLPGSNLDHIGICSNRVNANGEPLIIHNVGAGTKEEDVLREYHIVDHFRVF